jgi:hypothetical protein
LATTMILFGSILGFLGAILAFAVFDAGFLVALAIWALSGPLLTIVVLAGMLRPEPGTMQDSHRTEVA